MPASKPIKSPAGYAPTFAIGYSDADGELAIVDTGTPLPVTFSSGEPISVQSWIGDAPAPFEGVSGESVIVGPYTPSPGRPLVITLSGTWEGEVQVERSSDAGLTRHPLTVAGTVWGNYTGNACEPVWEEQETGAQFYLAITIASGSVAYRIAQ